jgi:hypothetical protein
VPSSTTGGCDCVRGESEPSVGWRGAVFSGAGKELISERRGTAVLNLDHDPEQLASLWLPDQELSLLSGCHGLNPGF